MVDLEMVTTNGVSDVSLGLFFATAGSRGFLLAGKESLKVLATSGQSRCRSSLKCFTACN